MKTSHYLLIAAILITLTGMVATDVLLKQEYEKINWADKYQFFARRSLPSATHLVVNGTGSQDIVVESGPQAQALVAPADSLFFNFRVQRDTLYVSFNPDTTDHRNPRDDTWAKSTGLVLRLPAIQSLTAINTRLILQNSTMPALDVSLRNSLLFADQLTVPNSFRLVEYQNSLAKVTKGKYRLVELTIQDSSAIHFDDAQMDAFSPTLSDRAEVQFKGSATRWVK